MSIRNHFIAISSKNFNLRFYLATFGSVYSDSVYPWELLSVRSERLPTTNNHLISPGNAQPLRALQAVAKAELLSAWLS